MAGLLVVAYLYLLLHALELLGRLFPRACGPARLRRRWTDLWRR